MSDLVRFGVAMDRALLSEFDRSISARGYENRSEALRDLIRVDLTRAAWDAGAVVAATLTLVYRRHASDAVSRVCDDGRGHIAASLRVGLDAQRSLEVLAVRGRASELAALAGHLAGTRGVLTCELTLAAPIEAHALPSEPLP
jgi:CopG family nickel-responsive transcriptional regulator